MLATLYLIFNEGYFATPADVLVRTELADEAIRLARVLVETAARRPRGDGAARADAAPALAARRPPRTMQARWCCWRTRTARAGTAPQIDEGLGLVETLHRASSARTRSRPGSPPSTPGPRAAEETDWRRIGLLYGQLQRIQPSPVIELNRAIAVAMDRGPEAGLELIDAIEGLDRYAPFQVSRADLLARLGRRDDAAEAYRRGSSSAPTRCSGRF